MGNVLVVAEVADGKLRKTTHSAVTFAKEAAAQLGGSYDILVIGAGVDGPAAEAAKLGAGRIWRVEVSEIHSIQSME